MPSGNALAGEFQVNTYVNKAQQDARIAMDPAGDFVVIWSSDGQDGDGFGVYGQRFDAASNPSGGRVSGQYLHGQPPAIPGGGDGRHRGISWSVWASEGQDGHD